MSWKNLQTVKRKKVLIEFIPADWVPKVKCPFDPESARRIAFNGSESYPLYKIFDCWAAHAAHLLSHCCVPKRRVKSSNSNSLMLASLLSSWQLHWRVIHLASPLQPELIGLCRFRGKGKWWFQITISNKYLMLHLRSASLGWPLSSESAALGARERGPSGKHPRCGPSLVNATLERNESRHPLSKSKAWFLHRQSLPNPPIPAETHALGHRRLWSQFGAPIAMPLKISLESTDIHSIDGRLLKYTSVRRTPEQLQLSSHLPRGRGFLAAPQHSWDGQDGKGRQTVGGNVLQDWHLEH